MKNIVYIIALLLIVSCSTSPPRLPVSWEVMPNHIETRFPESSFLTFRGQAPTKIEAEENALAELRRYFITRVNQSFTNMRVISNKDGNIENLVDYFLEIFEVRYANETNTDIFSNDWVAIAYIDRDRAWRVYAPRFKIHADNFSRLYSEAEKETDPFQKALRFTQALEYTQTVDFIIEDIFGQLLHPVRMNELYLELKMQMAKLPQLRQNAMWNVKIYIYCKNDFDSILYNAFAEGFNNRGFPITNDRESATAVCEIEISDDFTLKAIVTGASGVIDSIVIQAEYKGDKKETFTELARKVRWELGIREDR